MPEGMGLTYVGHPSYFGPHFSDEAHGVIELGVPVKQLGDSRQLIYTTDDGGETWTLQTKPSTQFDGSIPAILDSSWVGVSHSDGKISIKGPSHKATFALPKGVPQTTTITKTSFIDAEHGWLLTFGGELLGINGGASANVLVSPSTAPKLPPKPQVAPSQMLPKATQLCRTR